MKLFKIDKNTKFSQANLQGLLLIAVFSIFVLKDAITGKASLIKPRDSFDQSFSWLSKVFNAAEDGRLVLWDFNVQSGVSFIGELQTGALWILGAFSISSEL